MKKCANCGYMETNDARFCSNCACNSFVVEVPASSDSIGYATAGPVVQPSSCSGSTASPGRSAGRALTYTGLVALTFFMPFIGGYFLIRPGVPAGCRNFGIAWCTLIGIGCAISGAAGDLAISLIAGALCILPAVIYAGRVLFEKRKADERAECAEREKMEALLQMPLEKFGDRNLEELEKKYEGQ